MVHMAVAPAITNEKRKNLIINFILRHDGCNKQAVINGLDQTISRVTILNLIDELVKSGILELRTEKENSRDHKLSVSRSNLLYSLPKQLQDFKRYYEQLCDRVIEAINNENSHATTNQTIAFKANASDLLYNTLYLFKIMVDTCMYKSVTEWPGMISDKDKLFRLYGIIFESIAEIHKDLYTKMRSSKLKQFGNLSENIWSQIFDSEMNLDELAKPFEHYNLFQEVQKLYSTDAVRNSLGRQQLGQRDKDLGTHD